jgi:hypothetical protein
MPTTTMVSSTVQPTTIPFSRVKPLFGQYILLLLVSDTMVKIQWMLTEVPISGPRPAVFTGKVKIGNPVIRLRVCSVYLPLVSPYTSPWASRSCLDPSLIFKLRWSGSKSSWNLYKMPAVPVSYKPEVVEYQLSNISLLQSMYPSLKELNMMPYSRPVHQALEDDPCAAVRAERIEFIHTTSIEYGEMDIIILLPLARSRIELNLRQPSWLTRAEWEHVRDLPASEEDDLVVEYLLETLDLIRSRVGGLLKYKIQAAQAKALADAEQVKVEEGGEGVGSGSIPLSSKEKRKDLVTFAEEHLLSGFLLAGEFLTLKAMKCPLNRSRQARSPMRGRMWKRGRPIHVSHKIGELVRYPSFSEKGESSRCTSSPLMVR